MSLKFEESKLRALIDPFNKLKSHAHLVYIKKENHYHAFSDGHALRLAATKDGKKRVF